MIQALLLNYTWLPPGFLLTSTWLPSDFHPASSLQLAAALVDLAGPGWLLARGEQLPEAFLQVLAETIHVRFKLF